MLISGYPQEHDINSEEIHSCSQLLISMLSQKKKIHVQVPKNPENLYTSIINICKTRIKTKNSKNGFQLCLIILVDLRNIKTGNESFTFV